MAPPLRCIGALLLIFRPVQAISPAAIECHMTMSLSEQSPLCMSVSADTAGERQFLPEAHTLTNCLLLAAAQVTLTGLGLSR